MPIHFSDVEDDAGLGSAAFLRLRLKLTLDRSTDDACCLGALLVISPRGEPLEFGYNRVRVPQPYLWRPADLRRYTERRLTTSLLSVCSQQPRLLVCLASEVSTGLFTEDLRLEIPVVRLCDAGPVSRRVDTETGEVLEEDDERPTVTWQPDSPDGSEERRLFEHLAAHGLLFEPFDRADIGLDEVYGPNPCQSG